MPEPREEWHFDTRHIGRRVLVFDELDSTNERAIRHASASEGPIAILARHQTAGRGRFGRVWRSRPGSALLLSVAFQPPAELRRPSVLTVWAAVAVAEAVYRLTSLDAAIKWPNDLLVNGHKICGILIEQSAATVVGIGLNLNQTREEFDTAGLPLAASLASLSGTDVELKAAAEAVLRSLDEEYQSLLNDYVEVEGRVGRSPRQRTRPTESVHGGPRVLAHASTHPTEEQSVEEKWRARTGLMDREVEVERSDGSRLRGTLVRLTFDDVELDTASGRVRFAPEMVEHITARPAAS